MKRITPHIISILYFIIIFQNSFSQSPSVKASIDKEKILIGEPIELKLEAKVPIGTDAKWFPVDSMAHFEVINKGKIDTVTNSDFKTFTQTVVLTSFDSGRWALAALPLEIGNKQYLTDSFPVSVAYSNFDPSKDYHDIKDIVEVENAYTRYINWVLAALAILSLTAIVYFLRKKPTIHPVLEEKQDSKLLPLDEALESLDVLRKQGFPKNGEVKTFHTRLNDILRWYLYRRANLSTKEKTSGELAVALKQFNLSNEEFIPLCQTLRMGDAVKFAKYRPLHEENEDAFQRIKNSIEELDKIISS